MVIRFLKTNPTQNMTILVKDVIPRAEHGPVAEQMMSYDHVYAEQVGFIEMPQHDPAAWARLQMAGGEFCGNAAISLAAALVRDRGLTGKVTVPLEVSGADKTVQCRVIREVNGYRVRICMPGPFKLESFQFDSQKGEIQGMIVHMPGISHYVMKVDFPDNELETIVQEMLQKLPKKQAALGLMFIREVRDLESPDGAIREKEQMTASMIPFIHVYSTITGVWERGCGSGTAAAGCWLAAERGRSLEAGVQQPGGEMKVWVEYDPAGIQSVHIEGIVQIVCEGTAFVSI